MQAAEGPNMLQTTLNDTTTLGGAKQMVSPHRWIRGSVKVLSLDTERGNAEEYFPVGSEQLQEVSLTVKSAL